MFISRNRYDALDALDEMRRHLDGFFRSDLGLPNWADRVDSALVAPRIEENDDQVRIIMEAPGMTAEDVTIELNGDLVVIRAERNPPQPEDMKAVRRERSTLRFQRKFRLSDRVDAEGIEARFDKGVLSVRLPKKAPATPRQIPVQAA